MQMNEDADGCRCRWVQMQMGADGDAHWVFWLIILEGFSFGHNFLPLNIQKPTDTSTVIESPYSQGFYMTYLRASECQTVKSYDLKTVEFLDLDKMASTGPPTLILLRAQF